MNLNNIKKFVVLLIFSLLIVGCRNNTNEKAETSHISVEQAVLQAPCGRDERFAATKKLFSDAGAEDIEIQGAAGTRNIIAKINGKSRETIYVGAHYDKVEKGCGAIDNWTGVVILTRLYELFKSEEIEKSITFIAFDGEESGLKGSMAFTDSLSTDDLDDACAYINFDSFGFKDSWALKESASPKLIEIGEAVAKKRGVSFDVIDIPTATSDATSFDKIGIPSITISGLGDDWNQYLHTENDQATSVEPKMIQKALQFGQDFIRAVDHRDCSKLQQ